MARFNGNHIEHPDRYAEARVARIKANGNLTRSKKLAAADREVLAWLLYATQTWPAGFSPNAVGLSAIESEFFAAWNVAKRCPFGTPPQFLLDSFVEWGGLTEKQLQFAQKIRDGRRAQSAAWAAKDAAEKANALQWVAGRQIVEGVVWSARAEWFAANGYGAGSEQVKAIVKTDDGRKLWSTLPRSLFDAALAEAHGLDQAALKIKGQRVRFTVTVEPKADDPTFAFGSRPSKAALVAVALAA